MLLNSLYFGLLGTGQLALTKAIILVSQSINPRNWSSVLQEIHNNFDPHYDFVLLPRVPIDTLDFTSFKMELGSKMIIDATKPKNGLINVNKNKRNLKYNRLDSLSKDIRSFDRRIADANLISDTLLIVKVRSDGRAIVEKLVKHKDLQTLKIIAAVSDDIDIRNQESYIWGIFTRFDCARDIVFSEQDLNGISPIYNGVMGIDATWKKGYPAKLEMDPNVIKYVDKNWDSYWK
jgi:3-polyprenyl-4-hydroxybenzoate decarboxylase